MSSILTVEAKLKGDAASLVGAARRGADALEKVADAAKKAKQAGDGFEGVGQKIAHTFGGMLRLAAQTGIGIASFGAKVAGAMVKIASRAAIAGAALTTVFVGGAIKQGLDRLMSIQDATVALTRMLGGAEQAAKLTNEVLKVVQGTPFAFPQFAEATRQLVAFGVKAEKIPLVLTAIADSAAASGEGAEAVGRITQAFANMAVTGKMNSDIIQSLGSAGVNALGLLANHFGITTAEAQAMVSDGMIPAEEAMDILVDGIENGSKGIAGDFKALKGAAQDLGKTISGSLGNVKAAFARMGATWLKPFEKDFPAVLNDGVIPLLDKLGDSAGRMIQKFADSGALTNVLEALQGMLTHVDPLIGRIVDFVSALSPFKLVFDALKDTLPAVTTAFDGVWQKLQNQFIPMLANLATELVPLLPAFADLASALVDGLIAIAPTAIDLLGFMVDAFANIARVIADLPDPILGFVTALAGLEAMGVPVIDILGEIASSVFDLLGVLGESGGEGLWSGLLDGMDGVIDKSGDLVGAGGLGKVIGFLGGPWGAALVGAAGALAFFAAATPNAIHNADALTASLDAQTGAVTSSTRAIVAKALTETGAISSAKELGISAKLLTDAAMGNAEALTVVESKLAAANEKWMANREIVDGMPVEADAMSEAINNVSQALGEQNSEITVARDQMQQQLQAIGAVDVAQQTFKDAIDAATTSVDINGATLDENTSQGKANKAQLDKVIQAAEGHREAMINSGTATDVMNRRLWDSIAPLMETMQKMGMTKEEAAKLTGEVLGIPASKVIDIYAHTQEAIDRLSAVKGWIDSINSKSISIEAHADTGIRHFGAGADGALVGAFANGGITGVLSKFAGGGGFGLKSVPRVPQLRSGREGTVMWGEPETGWEAYISGKSSQRARNEKIWAMAGDKLGIPFPGADGSGMSVQIHVHAAPGMDEAAIVALIEAKFRFLMGSVRGARIMGGGFA